MFAITIITPLINSAIAELWFSEAFLFLIPFPVISAAALLFAFYKTVNGSEYWPFYGGIFCFVGAL